MKENFEGDITFETHYTLKCLKQSPFHCGLTMLHPRNPKCLEQWTTARYSHIFPYIQERS